MATRPDGDVYGLLAVLAYATARALSPQQLSTYRAALSELQQAAAGQGSVLSAEVIGGLVTAVDRAGSMRRH
jgi:DNA-binding transcriptional regulator of glucitol operon